MTRYPDGRLEGTPQEMAAYVTSLADDPSLRALARVVEYQMIGALKRHGNWVRDERR